MHIPQHYKNFSNMWVHLYFSPAVGSAWLPLLRDGRVIMNEQHLPVAANLPARYLSSQDGVNKVKEEIFQII